MASAAVPASPAKTPTPAAEPVWLVRAVLALFLVGFAAYLARELRVLADAIGWTGSKLYWTGLAVGLAIGLAAGVLLGITLARRRRENQ